ncbi:glycoside hydrolase family 2 TIM barrel-domain containing protein [Pedobacter sp. KLB.chiD]|uniref:glycoside hydrolase family 2 protein n=1 Tax=Pedobacter sp. KLB.chiD TaxID=3387402 RepID=UPI00399BD265
MKLNFYFRRTVVKFNSAFSKHFFPNFIFLLLLNCFLTKTSFAQKKQSDYLIGQTGRTTLNWNRDWKFKPGKIEDQEIKSINTSQWLSVGIPHSFSIPYFMSPDFYVGYGHYQKQFNLEPWIKKSKKVFLEFEGVFQEAEIFVNGIKSGSHKGGYTGFSIDISKQLKPGKNTIDVRVNNLWRANLAPRAGEHVFSGGIYRDVKLIFKDPVHIDWCGTSISTPEVTKEKANVEVQTEINNTTAKAQKLRIETKLFDPDLKQVQVMTMTTLAKTGINKIKQLSASIKKPLLWHPDHPYLYMASTTVYLNDRKIDEQKQSFGIRFFRWTADQGFFLNGEHLYIRGANVHQDQAGWGDAVTNRGFYRDVKMVKDAGFNFIRGSHYPHDPAFAEACDKIGLLFWSENNFWGIGGSDQAPEGYWNTNSYPQNPSDTAAFNRSAEQELKEMIRINRNHPSIVVWSISNEPFFTSKNTLIPMRNLLKKLVKVVHQEDPGRPAAVGGAQRPIDDLRIDKIGDIAGYNGDGASIAAFQNPGIPNIISEYGGTFANRPGEYDPGWGDLASANGEPKYAWRSGQVIWCAFDHGSIAGESMAKLGIVDYFRIPKRAWYWYRNHYLGIAPPEWPKPGAAAALRLEADQKIAATDGTDDVFLKVTVVDAAGIPLSNSPDVKLEIVSGPGEFPTGTAILFSEKSDIRILDGQAAIALRSWYSGKTIIRATSPGLKSTEINIEFKGSHAYSPENKVKDRPYTRFKRSDQQRQRQVFGRNNPTFASSSAEGYSSGLAADGEKSSWWKPIGDDRSPYWILDMEKKVAINEIQIQFPASRNYRFKVEVSDDRNEWKMLSDFSHNQESIDRQLLDNLDVSGRYIRISFMQQSNIGLADVSVSGMVNN